ncbi:MAG TPA: restriction endonuclease [Streptomyces sp.]|nr:restriction endonuclease [Streptomyces sp.]
MRPRPRPRPRWWRTITGWAVVALLAGMAVLAWAQAHPTAAGLVLLAVITAGTAVNVGRKRILAGRRQVLAARAAQTAQYNAMDAGQFEHAVANLCLRDGCRDVRVTGRPGDLGADVTAVAPDGCRVVIQCKRYGPATKVSSPDLQRFGGTCFTVHGAHHAVVVTTGQFTAPALDYARAHGILCYDQTALTRWASGAGPAPWGAPVRA